MTIITDVNIRHVLFYLAPGKEYGWNPDAANTVTDPDIGHTMHVVNWRDTGSKPSEAAAITEWDANPQKYEIVNLSAVVGVGENEWDVTVTKKHDIDGLTSMTLTVDGDDMPVPISLTDGTGTQTLTLLSTATIGISDDYPHDEIEVA